MRIRRLRTDDAPALRQCRLAGLDESPEAFLATRDEVAGVPLQAIASELADDDICYVGAFVDGALVGFMRFVRFQRRARRHVAEVRSVYVTPAVRGRQLATRLLQHLVEAARAAGIESLVLSVLADNTAARRLYESCGFRLHGMEPRAVRKGERYIDLALYSLDLVAPR